MLFKVVSDVATITGEHMAITITIWIRFFTCLLTTHGGHLACMNVLFGMTMSSPCRRQFRTSPSALAALGCVAAPTTVYRIRLRLCAVATAEALASGCTVAVCLTVIR